MEIDHCKVAINFHQKYARKFYDFPIILIKYERAVPALTKTRLGMNFY